MAKSRAAALRERKNAQVQGRKQQAEARMQSQLDNEKQRQMQYNAQFQPPTAPVIGGASPEQMAKLEAYGQYLSMAGNDPNASSLVQTAKTGMEYPNERAMMADQYIYDNMLQQGPPTQQVAALDPTTNANTALKQKLMALIGSR